MSRRSWARLLRLRRDRLYLLDIVDACKGVERQIKGARFEGFVRNEAIFEGTVRNLQNVGEAFRRLPPATLELDPELKWAGNVGLNQFFIRSRSDWESAYRGADYGVAWDLATDRCPRLLKAAENALALLPDGE